MKPIYLDYNATTPLDSAAREAMLPYLGEHFGNPSSAHWYGKAAREAVETARRQVADFLGAQPKEIVFTSGGTEATNYALKGLAFSRLVGRSDHAPHFVTAAVEHPATLETCRFLERLGCPVTVVGVDRFGRVDPRDIRKALRPSTAVVSVMHANNEVGTLQPVREIADIAHAQGVLMHTDAAQSAGKIAVNVRDLGVDLLSLAGHKVYAPKGVGALFVREGVTLEPLLHGAGHEAGRRAGTENVPYVAALGAACREAARLLPAATERLRVLRDRLWESLVAGLGDRVLLNGHPSERLPNTLNVSFVGHVGSELLQHTSEVAASTGSACHDGQVALSPVLKAMGVAPEIGQGAVRLSVGRHTTEHKVDQAARALVRAARGEAVGADGRPAPAPVS